MMQAGGEAKWKCAFLKGPLSSCLGLTFSLYLFQVEPMWQWCAELSTWWFMTLGGATHLQMIGPPSYNLNSYKRLLIGGPLFLQKVIWPFMCTVVRRAHFFFYAIFYFIFKLWAKATFEFAYPPPFHLIWPISTQDSEKHLVRKCVYSLTHTHTQKSKSSFHWNNRESSL